MTGPYHDEGFGEPDCPVCKGAGYVAVVVRGGAVLRPCPKCFAGLKMPEGWDDETRDE